jgi:hypothetical protein
MATDSYSTWVSVCGNGHTVIWAGDPNCKLPEGTPCACGLTVVHYEYCPTCQQTRMVMIPRGVPK